jgi:hypothetical protein
MFTASTRHAMSSAESAAWARCVPQQPQIGRTLRADDRLSERLLDFVAPDDAVIREDQERSPDLAKGRHDPHMVAEHWSA